MPHLSTTWILTDSTDCLPVQFGMFSEWHNPQMSTPCPSWEIELLSWLAYPTLRLHLFHLSSNPVLCHTPACCSLGTGPPASVVCVVHFVPVGSLFLSPMHVRVVVIFFLTLYSKLQVSCFCQRQVGTPWTALRVFIPVIKVCYISINDVEEMLAGFLLGSGLF